MIDYKAIADEFISRMCVLTTIKETISELISLNISIVDIRDELLFKEEDIISVWKDREFYRYEREIGVEELLAFGLTHSDILQHKLS